MKKIQTTTTDVEDLLVTHGYGVSEGTIAAAAADTGVCHKDLAKAVAFIAAQEADNLLSEFTFTLLGNPPVSQRPRAVRLRRADGTVAGVRMYAPDGDVQMSMAEAMRNAVPEGFVPFQGAVDLTLVVAQAMPSGWPKYRQFLGEAGYIRPEAAPDWDNRAKVVVDAMRGILFKDDGQVTFGSVTKLFSVTPRIDIHLRGRKFRSYT